MRAIVLIGGKGTRLRPLTWRTPKQLVPVLNRPLLAYLLDALRSHGFDRVTFAMTGRDEDIEAAFTGDASPPGLAIECVLEGEPLGSGGAIANASSGWDEPFLVCNGDIVSDIDLGAFAGEHRRRDAELSIALSEAEDPSRFGVVVLGDGDRVTRFVEKPPREEAPSRLINAGLWLFEPGVGHMLDADRINRVEDELFPNLAAAGRGIFGHRHAGYWADIGNPEAYLQTNLDLLAGAAPALLPADWPGDGRAIGAAALSAGARVEAPALLGAGTRVAEGARIEGGVVTGARCEIGRGAVVSGSVLWDGVSVGEGAQVRDSVLAEGARVGTGAVVEGAVLAHGAAVEAGERPPSGTLLEPEQIYRDGRVLAPTSALVTRAEA